MGSLVPGCRGGSGLFGISAAILYQCVGISDSGRRIFLFAIVFKFACPGNIFK
jgi:hypothetical protein